MIPGPAAPPTCRVCGRDLDGVRVVELKLTTQVLRACAGACRTVDDAARCRPASVRPEMRTRVAGQLQDLCADIDRASGRGEITFREALPMLLKLTGEQCELLWVTDLSARPTRS